jgi:hypothetical protein
MRMEAVGSPVVTDGEQRKPSFATYPVHGLASLGGGGVVIPFADGHTRELPVITEGPFRYRTHADVYLRAALPVASSDAGAYGVQIDFAEGRLVLAAAKHIPLDQLGTTDGCGFSPFADDRSTARDTAFEKIRARVEGTALASQELLS